VEEEKDTEEEDTLEEVKGGEELERFDVMGGDEKLLKDFLMQHGSDVLNFLDMLSSFSGFELFFFLMVLLVFKLDFNRTESSCFFVLYLRVSYQVFSTTRFFFCFKLFEQILVDFAARLKFVFLPCQLKMNDFGLMADMEIFLEKVNSGVVKTEEGEPPSSPGIMEDDGWTWFLHFVWSVGGLTPLHEGPRQVHPWLQRIQKSELETFGRIKLPPGF
jgi:hypothetical protein